MGAALLYVGHLFTYLVRYWKMLLKWAILGLFFVYFYIFKQTLQFLQQINVKNVHPVHDLNPRPLEHESPPITTRPWLPFLGTG